MENVQRKGTRIKVMAYKESLTNQGLRKEKNREFGREVFKDLGGKKCRMGPQTVLYQNNYGALYVVIVQVVSSKLNKPLFKPQAFQSLPQDAMGGHLASKREQGDSERVCTSVGLVRVLNTQALRKPSNHQLPEPGKVLHGLE